MKKDTVVVLVIVSLLLGFVAGVAAGIRYASGESRPGMAEGPGPAPQKAPSGEEIGKLEAMVKADPNNLEALVSLGNRYFDAHQYRKAVDAYSRALAINPRNPDVRTDMAVMYRGLKDYDRAVKELREAASQDPNHVNSRYNLGIILLHDKKDMKGATAAWEDCLRAGATGEQAEMIRQQLKALRDLSG